MLRPDDDDGIVRQNTLDIVGGLDFALPADTRLNLQLFARTFFDHDPDIISKRHEPGFSVLLNHRLGDRLKPRCSGSRASTRTDWMLRPRVIWNFEANWSAIFGVDVFQGPPLGFFGQFDNRDRVYTELREQFLTARERGRHRVGGRDAAAGPSLATRQRLFERVSPVIALADAQPHDFSVLQVDATVGHPDHLRIVR